MMNILSILYSKVKDNETEVRKDQNTRRVELLLPNVRYGGESPGTDFDIWNVCHRVWVL